MKAKNIQPNFEAVKTAFYQAFVMDTKIDMILVLETVSQKKLQEYFPKRIDKFKNELNKWLDTVDIRCAGQLIDSVLSHTYAILVVGLICYSIFVTAQNIVYQDMFTLMQKNIQDLQQGTIEILSKQRAQ